MLNTKIKFNFRNLVAFAGLVGLFLYAFIVQSGAQPSFSESYKAEGNIKSGMIVKLKEGDPSTVQPVNFKEINKMHGVVIDHNDSPVTLSTEGEEIFVATGGRFKVLVSDLGGDIKAGDYITLSQLNGIGKKADSSQQVIFGRAAEAFGPKAESVGSSTVKNEKGENQNTRLGKINVDIGIAKNPLHTGEEPNVPDYMRRASNTIAGKEVSANRIYASMAVLLISTLISVSLLYGGVRAAMTAVGRNPLSKKIILRGMAKVIITGLTIFIIGLFAVYLLLKL